MSISIAHVSSLGLLMAPYIILPLVSGHWTCSFIYNVPYKLPGEHTALLLFRTTIPSKPDTSTQCWPNVCPPSMTLAQHWPNVGSMCRVCWDAISAPPGTHSHLGEVEQVTVKYPRTHHRTSNFPDLRG